MERALAVAAILLGIAVIGGGSILAVTLMTASPGAPAQEAATWDNATVEVRCYTSECAQWAGQNERVRLMIERAKADPENGTYDFQEVLDMRLTINKKYRTKLYVANRYRVRIQSGGDIRTLGIVEIEPGEPFVVSPFPCCGTGQFPTPADRYRTATPTPEAGSDGSTPAEMASEPPIPRSSWSAA